MKIKWLATHCSLFLESKLRCECKSQSLMQIKIFCTLHSIPVLHSSFLRLATTKDYLWNQIRWCHPSDDHDKIFISSVDIFIWKFRLRNVFRPVNNKICSDLSNSIEVIDTHIFFCFFFLNLRSYVWFYDNGLCISLLGIQWVDFRLVFVIP